MGFAHFEGGVELLTQSGFSWKVGMTFCNFGSLLGDPDLLWLPLPFSTVSWWFGKAHSDEEG